jgi:hypothetical protein
MVSFFFEKQTFHCRLLWRSEETCAAGAHVWQIPFEGLPPGVYHARFQEKVLQFVKY